MAPFFYPDNGTGFQTWVPSTAASIYWVSQTPTATSTVYWIPVNGGTSPTITSINTIIPSTYIYPITRLVSEPPINRGFVPCTPAIIRRLCDQHEREEDRVRRLAEEQATRERIQQEAVAARFVREAAKQKANELLLAHLTPEQRRTFEENEWFVVEGGKTKQKYKINIHSYAGNIEVVGMNQRLCCHADSRIPQGDQLLAQKVMLELAEDDFLRLANRTMIR
jgi:hypothetical protein